MGNQKHHIPFATKQRIVWFAVLLTFGFSQYGYPLATASGSEPARVSSVETVRFQSQLVNATLPYNVILPPDYRAASATRYPVLYLLHGLSGHYSDWVTRTNIADYAAAYRLIIVMPEGNDSWYVDSGGVPSDKYETYILKELIPDVDKRFRTIQSRYGRAVAGLSMGGYGAVKYGLKYPSTFAFAASMSGAFGVTRYTENEMGGSNWEPFLKTFGPVGSETRKANDVFEITRGLTAARVASLPFFYFDCGTEDASRHLRCLSFTLIVAPRMRVGTSMPIAGYRNCFWKRKSRTSIANCPVIIAGSTGISRCRRFCRSRRSRCGYPQFENPGKEWTVK